MMKERVRTESNNRPLPFEHNGWVVQQNAYNGFPAKKLWIAFHPMYDGAHWQDFDTLEEAIAFCTVERYSDWSNKYL